jgi:hypothetical protein
MRHFLIFLTIEGQPPRQVPLKSHSSRTAADASISRKYKEEKKIRPRFFPAVSRMKIWGGFGALAI